MSSHRYIILLTETNIECRHSDERHETPDIYILADDTRIGAGIGARPWLSVTVVRVTDEPAVS